MAKEIVNRTVSFNILDPLQEQLYKHTKKYTNYSAYVKSLILRDMEGGKESFKREIEPPVKNNKQFDNSLMSQLI